MANHGEAPIRRLEINLILPKGLEGKNLTKRDGVLQAKADRNIVWLIKAVHPGSYLVRVKAQGELDHSGQIVNAEARKTLIFETKEERSGRQSRESWLLALKQVFMRWEGFFTVGAYRL